MLARAITVVLYIRRLAVLPTTDKKGFSVVLKKGKNQLRPAKNTVRVGMKAGPRRLLKKLRHLLTGNKYRNDLTQAALRRASALLCAQNPAQVKKKSSKAE